MSAIAALSSARQADPFRRAGDALGCIVARDESGGGDGPLADLRYLAEDLLDVLQAEGAATHGGRLERDELEPMLAARLRKEPAIALPCRLDGDGMPIGAQLVGPAGSDLALLELAAGLQGAGVWRDVEPTDFSAIIESRS